MLYYTHARTYARTPARPHARIHTHKSFLLLFNIRCKNGPSYWLCCARVYGRWRTQKQNKKSVHITNETNSFRAYTEYTHRLTVRPGLHQDRYLCQQQHHPPVHEYIEQDLQRTGFVWFLITIYFKSEQCCFRSVFVPYPCYSYAIPATNSLPSYEMIRYDSQVDLTSIAPLFAYMTDICKLHLSKFHISWRTKLELERILS